MRPSPECSEARLQEPRLRSMAALAFLGIGIAAALWLPDPEAERQAFIQQFRLWYAAAFVMYFLACIMIVRRPSLAASRAALLVIVAFALCARASVLVRQPPLSTDMHRYVWDGKVANSGINPYRYAPSSRELRHLRDENWRSINHRRVPTIYPPLSQIAFAALWRLRPGSEVAFRLAFAGFELACLFTLFPLLRIAGIPRGRIVLYAWSPLVITELGGGGHQDSLGLLLMLVALWALMRGRRISAGAALGASMMAKGYAVLLLPLFLRRGGGRFLIAACIAVAALAAPFAGAGLRMLAGLSAYWQAWSANAPVLQAVSAALSPVTAGSFAIARWLTSGAVAAAAVWLAARPDEDQLSTMRKSFAALCALMLIGGPTLPWYVAWTVPFLCFWPVPGWLLFTCLVSSFYYALFLDSSKSALYMAMEYPPVYALLAWDFVRSRIAQRETSARSG